MEKRKRKKPAATGCKNLGEQALREVAEWFRQCAASAQAHEEATEIVKDANYYACQHDTYEQAAWECDRLAAEYRRKRKVSA